MVILPNAISALDILVEGKAAYFAPSNNRFERIYSGGEIYGLEVTGQVWNDIYAWGDINYFTKAGHSIGGHEPTRINMVPFGFGLKYFFPVQYADFYLGAGVTGTYLHMKDDSSFDIRHISKWGVGGVAKAGAIIPLNDYLFIDLFANYTFCNIDFHRTDHHEVARHHADLSGWVVGGGIGYRFGCPKASCCQ